MRPVSVRVTNVPRTATTPPVAPARQTATAATVQAAPARPASAAPPASTTPRGRTRRMAKARPAVLVAKAEAASAPLAETVPGEGGAAAGAETADGGQVEQDAAASGADLTEEGAPPPPPPPPPPPADPEPSEELLPPEPVERPFGRFPAGVVRPDAPVRVVVSLDVTAAGAVSAARVARSAGEPFDAEALSVARSLQFRPARRGGRPVALTVPWVVTFR